MLVMLLSMIMTIVIMMLVLIPYTFQTLLFLNLAAQPLMLEDEIMSKDLSPGSDFAGKTIQRSCRMGELLR